MSSELTGGVSTEAACRPVWARPESYWQPSHLVESAWIGHAPFAFWITAALEPSIFVELGTHNGFSYFAFCEAVRRLGLDTKCFAIDTWEGDDHAGFYDESVFELVRSVNFEQYDAFSKLLRGYFDDNLAQFSDGSIDLLHIDGQHGYDDVKHDYEAWLPKMSPRGVILFHDIAVRERGFGVWKLWEEVNDDYPSFAFDHAHGLGVLVVGKDLPTPVLAFANAGSEEASAIRQHYSELGAVTAAAGALDLEREQLRAAITDSERRLAESEHRAEGLEVTVDQLVNSVAWRSTKPLRAIFGLVPDGIRIRLKRPARPQKN